MTDVCEQVDGAALSLYQELQATFFRDIDPEALTEHLAKGMAQAKPKAKANPATNKSAEPVANARFNANTNTK